MAEVASKFCSILQLGNHTQSVMCVCVHFVLTCSNVFKCFYMFVQFYSDIETNVCMCVRVCVEAYEFMRTDTHMHMHAIQWAIQHGICLFVPNQFACTGILTHLHTYIHRRIHRITFIYTYLYTYYTIIHVLYTYAIIHVLD